MDNRNDERVTPRFLRSILETAGSPVTVLPWVYSSARILFLGAKFTGISSDILLNLREWLGATSVLTLRSRKPGKTRSGPP